MFKQSSFEEEIINEMYENITSNNEQKEELNKISSIFDSLNKAAAIFESYGFHSQASQITEFMCELRQKVGTK